MGKYFYFIVTAALLLTSCANNDIINEVPEQQSKILTLGVEIPQDNNTTRSTFNEEETDNSWSVVWEVGDKIQFCFEYTVDGTLNRDLVAGTITAVNQTDKSKATADVVIPEAITANQVAYKIYAATGCGYIGTPTNPIMTATDEEITVNTEATDVSAFRNLTYNARKFLDRNIMVAKVTTDIPYDATNVGLKFEQIGSVFDVRVTVLTGNHSFKCKEVYLESSTDWVYEAGTAKYDMIADTWSGTPSKTLITHHSNTYFEFQPGQTGNNLTWFVSTGTAATDLTFWLNKNSSEQHNHQVVSGTMNFENGERYLLARNWDGNSLVK